MNTSNLLSQNLIEFLNGGNLTGSSLKEHLDDIKLKEATKKIGNLNTIALLTFHINYYLGALIKVLEGGPLDAKDALSFTMKELTGKKEWEQLRASIYQNFEKFALLVEDLSEKELQNVFVKDQYGSYQRNIMGLIEHSHYHLGQIVILKKLIRSQSL